MIRTIGQRLLAAVDASDYSQSVIKYICRMIPPEGKKVVLLSVRHCIPEAFWDIQPGSCRVSTLHSALAWENSQKKHLDDFMATAKKMLLEAGYDEKGIEVKIEDIITGVARDIIAESHSGYAAVLVGRKGFSQIKELVLGGVSTKLVNRLTETPLVLIGAERPARRVMLAVDGSDTAKRAVSVAAQMLATPDCDIVLFHAIRSFNAAGLNFSAKDMVREDQAVWFEDHLRHIRHFLNESAGRLVKSGFDPDRVKTKVVTEVTSRAWSIVQAAQEMEADTIIIGRRGLSEVLGNPMGRVSRKVLDLAAKSTVWIVN